MDERGLTQLGLVSALNRQYLTKYHQKDVSRWLNTGNRTTSGVIGFPKYETMSILADFFGVDVGYLTGETDERSFDMAHACEYIGLNHNAIQAIREWIDTGGDGQNANTGESSMREYRAQTLNDMLSSSTFAVLASKLLTLHEMSVIWRTNPSRFDSLMSSLASESDLSNTLTFQLVTEAFYGMANESFSALLRDAYPAPTERQFTQIQD
ncbi:XRE family transcriptional regulator [Bifidobacterium pseudolongum]|nr:XRE family transcriptional regulator [Bifidobacterium pseudolongum]